MKIFEWVQRKFHFNTDIHSTFSYIEEGAEHNMKKFKTITSETDTDVLLDHIAVTDVQQDWKDRLLSIGTLGLDPLELYNHFDGHFVEHIEEDANDDIVVDEDEGGGVKEEVNPLVVEVFRKELGNALLCLSSAPVLLKSDLPSTVDDEIDRPLLWFLESAELQIDRRNSTREEKKKNKGERTTLADLFSAETDATAAAATGKSDSTITDRPGRLEKTSCRKKHGLSFAKKFLSRKEDDDPLPITKVHRLIKKLLKKKIHPELHGKVHETNGPSPISAPK